MTDQKVGQNDTRVQVTKNTIDSVPSEQRSEEGKDISDMQIKRIVIGGYAFLLVFGITTGYLLSRSSLGAAAASKPGGIIKTGKVAGISDTKTFKDSAEGTVEKGGLSGEGTHKLIREGGPSQTVYLISSAVDLDEYAGKKVKVWGQTMAAKKAAWLMDVGKIELQ